MAFTFNLDTTDGAPTDPPSFTTVAGQGGPCSQWPESARTSFICVPGQHHVEDARERSVLGTIS